MKVSVIVPIYNTEPYIERCLNSVLQQSYNNLELLLIDDCGTDRSMLVASNLLQQSQQNIKILRHEENRGLSAARNTGLQAATGTYVYFLDSDDELPPRAIENLVKTATLYSHPHLVCGAVDVLPPGDHAQHIHDKVPAYVEGNKAVSRVLLTRQIPIMACNKLIDRDFLISNKLYFEEGLIHEDNLWTFTMTRYIHNMAITRQITYLYHIHKAGLTQERVTSQRIESIQTIITHQIKELSDQRPLRSLQQAYIYFTAGWFLELLNSQTHQDYYKTRQWIRTTLSPFVREQRYHTLKNRLLYRALYMPPGVLKTAKRIRNSAPSSSK
ncbi:MAG: glycosyltransferase family 2 protein [Bacteroidales bacterium]|nr:glycosyltransferase family 2 protein [Bacteroidales bacterium]